MQSLLYYSHSGRFSGSGLAAAIGATVGAGLVLAVLYAYLILYIPLAGFVSFLLAGGFGWGMGLVMAKMLKMGRVRNVALAVGSAVFAGLVGYAFSWMVWMYAFYHRVDVDVPFAEVMNPRVFWDLLTLVNESGAWTVSSTTPTGIALWVIWGLEATIVLGIAAWIPWKEIRDLTFCESCDGWCVSNKKAVVKGVDAMELTTKMEGHDFGYLEKVGAPAGDGMEFCRIELSSCPKCDATHTLTAQSVAVKVNKKGEHSEKKKTVLDRLLLTLKDAQSVRAVCDKLNAPPPATPEPPPNPQAA